MSHSEHDHSHDHGPTHDHNHAHENTHDHAHAHSHGPGQDPYYLDQLCLVAISAAFGCICLALYFWQRQMLKLMLREQFFPYVVGSGIVLIVFALIRAAILWVQVGKEAEHTHQPAPTETSTKSTSLNIISAAALTGVATGPAAEACGACPDHHHEHGHAGHSHADHEHTWSPWRYVLLLVPIVLFWPLGLPNKMEVSAGHVDVTDVFHRPTELGAAACVAMGPGWGQVASLAELVNYRETGPAIDIGFQTLESSAYQPDFRKEWQGKNVWVRGQFAPDPSNSNLFYLVRCRIQCCYADKIELNVPMITREAVSNVNRNDWVKVTGTVDYYQDAKKNYHTILRVNNRKNVEPATPDPEWYLQSK